MTRLLIQEIKSCWGCPLKDGGSCGHNDLKGTYAIRRLMVDVPDGKVAEWCPLPKVEPEENNVS